MVRDEASRVLQEDEFRSSLPAPGPSSRAAQVRDPLARSASTDFRVVQWNVGNRRWPQNPEPYRRILRALAPDIVLFDEVLDDTGEAWIRSFLGSVGPPDAAWQFAFARTGAWERSLVATHFPLATAFDRVSHTDETITRLAPVLEPFLPKTSPPPRKTLEDGVTASAAFMLLAAFDPAGGDLAMDSAVQLNGWSHATYTPGRSAPFPRSKLDYLLYSPSRLRLQHAFVFHSGALSRRWQRHHGIEPGDSDVTDHAAIVADFSWKE